MNDPKPPRPRAGDSNEQTIRPKGLRGGLFESQNPGGPVTRPKGLETLRPTGDQSAQDSQQLNRLLLGRHERATGPESAPEQKVREAFGQPRARSLSPTLGSNVRTLADLQQSKDTSGTTMNNGNGTQLLQGQGVMNAGGASSTAPAAEDRYAEFQRFMGDFFKEFNSDDDSEDEDDEKKKKKKKDKKANRDYDPLPKNQRRKSLRRLGGRQKGPEPNIWTSGLCHLEAGPRPAILRR